jgi:uncharacterized protein (DUF302 family)
MTSETVVAVVLQRHIMHVDRPFQQVLDGIFSGITRPDMNQLFSKLAASTTYDEFSALVYQAQGTAGLMLFQRLDLDVALALDPQDADRAGRQLVRLIAGNPVTMGEMTRNVSDAGSYVPVTILVEEMPGGSTRVAYDTVSSALAPYQDSAASQVANELDAKVLELLRRVTETSVDHAMT